MRKPLIAALVTAAVVGTAGGTVLAATAGGAGDADGRTAASDPAASDTGTPLGTAPSTTADTTPGTPPGTPPGNASGSDFAEVLWATPYEIHDGNVVVGYTIDDGVVPGAVWRTSTGYLVTVSASRTGPLLEAWTVTDEGVSTKLADFSGLPSDPDVSPDGTQVIGLDADRSGYQVIDIASGTRVGSVDFGSDPGDVHPGGRARFGGDHLFTSWHDGEAVHVVMTDLGSDQRDPLAVVDPQATTWDVSPDGSRIASTEVGNGDDSQQCTLVGATNAVDARGAQCGTRLTPSSSFSPDGRAVLGVPSDTEGFGPTSFDVVSSEGESVTRFTAPDLALDATLAAPDVLFVLSVTDTDTDTDGTGSVVSTCLADGCTEIGRSDDPVVLGTL